MKRTLKMMRNDERMTLAELAKKTGMSAGYLNHIENGKRVMTDDMVTKLARALNVAEREMKMIAETMRKNEELTRSWLANIIINGSPLVDAFEIYLSTHPDSRLRKENDLRTALLQFIMENIHSSVATELHTNKEFIAALGERMGAKTIKQN